MNDIIGEARTHRMASAKTKAEVTAKVANAAMIQNKSRMTFDRPIILRCMWFETNRRRDPDNIVAGKKYVLDGLVAAGILAKDGWPQVAGFDDKWDVSKEHPGVLVTVEEVT